MQKILLAAPVLALAPVLAIQSGADAASLRAPSAHEVVLTAHRTQPPINHQFCLSAGRHLCMSTAHAGINSELVLRINGHTRAQAITWNTGRLVITGHPGQCVGSDPHSVEARSVHCNGGHGIRWRRIVFPGRGIGFDNVSADRAFPGPDQHFLATGFQQPGQQLVIASNLHLPHVWRDCAGHCAAVRTVTLTRARTHTQYCLNTGRHLCIFALHRGPNSRIVLRPDRDVPGENIGFSFSQLRIFGFGGADMCIGKNARTIHCGRPGTGWDGLVNSWGVWRFSNAADTIHFPVQPHWLTAPIQDTGQPVIISTDWRLQHKWLVCTGNCTRPARAVAAAYHPRADRALGCAITMKARQLILNGHAVKQAYARTDCTTKPDSFIARLSLQQRAGGRWHTRASAPADSRSPYPHRYYWLNRTCGAGVWRARLTVTGSNSHGVALTSPVSFYSRPLTIRNCVGGGTAAQPAQAVLLSAHPRDAIFPPDCNWPEITVLRTGGRHPQIHAFGTLTCHRKPTALTSLMTLQQRQRDGSVQLLRITRTHEGLNHIGHKWVLSLHVKPHACATGRFRANWFSFGFSSTGDPDEGSFCTSPWLRIASCAPGGNDRSITRRIKCPDPLTS